MIEQIVRDRAVVDGDMELARVGVQPRLKQMFAERFGIQPDPLRSVSISLQFAVNRLFFSLQIN